MSQLFKSKAYSRLLTEIKDRIRSARLKAALAVNRELVLLYWEIGSQILVRQEDEGWGSKVIDNLAKDLARSFPEMRGFSPRNIKYMRAFAEAYRDKSIVQQLVAQIPWGHNVRILDYVKDRSLRMFYIQEIIKNGWSRDVLVHQIESGLHKRQGTAVTNFKSTLPPVQSDLARQIIKDPYNFDFLTLKDDFNERILEKALIDEVQKFLLELGTGFSFVGRQFHLEIGDQDYYMDLLFYHLKLRCFVVIELKTEAFKPEFAGKMNFYLSAVDDRLRHADDQPSIGIILCKTRNKMIAEYTLRDVKKPVGVSAYQLTSRLPGRLKGKFPTVDQLQARLGG